MQGTRIMLIARVEFDMTRALTIQDPEYKTQFQLSLNVKTQSTDGTL